MSAFDDEFGLFGDEETPDDERKPTLGARQISTGETIIDEIEPEDERPARRRGPGGGPPERGGNGTFERRPRPDRGPRPAVDPLVAQARATELLLFLVKRMVSKPDEVFVDLIDGARGPILELEVHPDDFGKVIGKGGRVAQALRTIVRASAEGKITIDIVDVEDDEEGGADHQAADDTDLRLSDVVPQDEADDEDEEAANEDAPEIDPDSTEDAMDTDDDQELARVKPLAGAKKKAPAKKTPAGKKGAKKKVAAKKVTRKKS